DCSSQVCAGGLCQPPLCNDGVKNQGETDTDCGGPCGATCAPGKSCSDNVDCGALAPACSQATPRVCVRSSCAFGTAGAGRACGPSANADCCGTLPVSGGTFKRSFDGGVTAGNASYPATVSDFDLDAYEVTVGRFRLMVQGGLGLQGSAPTAGSGAH